MTESTEPKPELKVEEDVLEEIPPVEEIPLTPEEIFANKIQGHLTRAAARKRQLALLLLQSPHFNAENTDAIVTRLRKAVRPTDDVAPWLASGIAVVLDDISDFYNAAMIARRLLALHDDALPELQHGFRIGIACYPYDATTAAVLIPTAEKGLSNSKESSYCYAHPRLQQLDNFTLNIEKDVERALLRQEFYLKFQAQFNILSQEIVGVEAQLNWNHPEADILGSAGVMNLVEKTRSIQAIEDWMFEQACETVARLRRAHNIEIVLYVPMQTRHLMRRGLLARLTFLLERNGIPFEFLNIQVTARTLIAIPNALATQISELQDIGVKLCISECGLGHSIERLQRCYFDSLKLSPHLMRELNYEPVETALARGIIQTAGTHGVEAIACGVDTAVQIQWLRQQGCNYAMGDYLCEAMKMDDLVAWLKRYRINARYESDC